MARSRLTNTSQDLISDGGAVLWSFVKGEQLEFPITLNFVEDVTAGYTYEAVVVEGDNVQSQLTKPENVKTNGIVTILNVRVPTLRGNWDAAQAYNREEIVLYNGKYYKLLSGVALTNITPPSGSTNWLETTLNKVYLQFPKSLASTWTQVATVSTPVYGFFELRVTEPQDNIFVRTWKPVRGMVEILFSPTYSAND
jgi:hypothetical protein